MTKNEKICVEYITGCCLKDEFLYGELTKRCIRIHSNELRDKYDNLMEIKKEHLLDAIYIYETFVEDLEKKIIQHRRMIVPKIDKSISTVLERVEEMIEGSNVDNFASVYKLIRLHGELVSRAENSILPNNLDVCSNCGAFKKKECECVHAFCKSYKKIRDILEKCKERGKQLKFIS